MLGSVTLIDALFPKLTSLLGGMELGFGWDVDVLYYLVIRLT